MAGEDEGATETPYAFAKRLHAQGTASPEIERALRSLGLDEDEARIAARAGRGEAGIAVVGVVESAPAPTELPSAPPSEAPAHPCPAHAEWPVLETCGRCGKFICARCLSEAGLLRLPSSKQCPACETRSPTPEGIGGWLILPALQVSAMAPLSMAWNIAQDVMALPELSRALVLPVVLELMVNAVMLFLTIFVAIRFFQRKRRAVELMLIFYVTMFLSALVGVGMHAWLESITGKSLPSDSTPHVFRTFISSVIWSSYFLQSKRVKATFVVP